MSSVKIAARRFPSNTTAATASTTTPLPVSIELLFIRRHMIAGKANGAHDAPRTPRPLFCSKWLLMFLGLVERVCPGLLVRFFVKDCTKTLSMAVGPQQPHEHCENCRWEVSARTDFKI